MQLASLVPNMRYDCYLQVRNPFHAVIAKVSGSQRHKGKKQWLNHKSFLFHVEFKAFAAIVAQTL